MHHTRLEWRCIAHQLRWIPNCARFYPRWQKTPSARTTRNVLRSLPRAQLALRRIPRGGTHPRLTSTNSTHYQIPPKTWPPPHGVRTSHHDGHEPATVKIGMHLMHAHTTSSVDPPGLHPRHTATLRAQLLLLRPHRRHMHHVYRPRKFDASSHCWKL
jgi:hypothetical protein